jgi:hypothetical protein
MLAGAFVSVFNPCSIRGSNEWESPRGFVGRRIRGQATPVDWVVSIGASPRWVQSPREGRAGGMADPSLSEREARKEKFSHGLNTD